MFSTFYCISYRLAFCIHLYNASVHYADELVGGIAMGNLSPPSHLACTISQVQYDSSLGLLSSPAPDFRHVVHLHRPNKVNKVSVLFVWVRIAVLSLPSINGHTKSD